MIPLIVALLFAPRAPGAALAPTGEAWQIMRDAQHAFESATESGFERRWRDVAARNPDDRRALLAAATIARMRYQYPRADSLFDQLAHVEPASAEYQAAAHLGMALWRTLGSDVVHADSLFAMARTEAMAAGDLHTAAQAVIGLAKLRSRRAGPKAGLELLRDARKLLDHPSTDESAQLLCTEGAMMEQIGDTTGRARLAEGIAIARRARAYRELGACDLFMAQTAERGGYFQGASYAAREAVQLFTRIHFPLGVATASQWLGYALLERGYFAAARVELDRAVSTGQKTRYQNVEAWARSDLADLYLALGDLETARAHAVRAAEMHSSYGDLWGLAIDLQFEGQIAQARGQLDEASAKYAASVAAFGRAGLGFNATTSLRLLALAQMSAGHLDSAQRALNEATRLARGSGNTGWNAEAPVHLARLAMARADYHTADSLLSSVRSHYASRTEASSPLEIHFAVLEAQLALRTQRLAAADSSVAFISAAITRRRQFTTDRELRAGLAQLRNGWGSLSESYPDLVARLSAAGRIGSAFRFIESVRAREIADGALRRVARIGDSTAALGEIRHASAPAPSLTLDDVRRGMARDAALVVLTLGINGAPTTAIVVTSDTAVAMSLPARDVIAPLVERYIRIAAAGTEPISVGRQLGASLLQPIVRVLPSRITHLQISPDGDLFRVPFDALRLADDRYAVEQFAISLVPSATVAHMLASAPAASNATRLVAIGDPRFSNERTDARRETPRANDTTRFGGVTLARLKHSSDEAHRVAQYGMSSVVWTRAEASEAAVRGHDWGGVGVAHFATHALIDADGQARTALALTPSAGDDGFLTTTEIASLRFNGSLVVLSACESLGGQILGGEGLRGLAAPLLEAGARAIVVTHWSIGDRSVLPFVDRFYAHMASGKSVGDALRETKLSAIRDGARISDWAAFTVIGDASMRPPLRLQRLSPLQWLHDLVQPTRDTSAARP